MARSVKASTSPRGQEGRARARQATAKARATDLKPTIEGINAEGIASLGKLASELTARRVPTARSNSEWTAMQVARLLQLVD